MKSKANIRALLFATATSLISVQALPHGGGGVGDGLGSFSTAVRVTEVAANAVKQGIAVNVRNGSDFRAYQAQELAKWAEVVKVAAVKLE